MKSELDYPCVCGHLAGQHAMEKSNIFKMCLMDYISTTPCNCDDYKPDNLRYLEDLSAR